MATYTTTQMAAAGVPAAFSSSAGSPGACMLEYVLDGKKKAIAAADIVTMYDISTYSGFIVDAATVEVLSAAVATATMDVGIAGTDITGATAIDIATVGSVIKLATGANTVATTSSASSLTLQFNTAGLGTGKLRVRVFGTLLDS
jgi:hypothetical protein